MKKFLLIVAAFCVGPALWWLSGHDFARGPGLAEMLVNSAILTVCAAVWVWALID
jgi:hypothetical protein